MLFNSLEYFLFFGIIFLYRWYIHPFLFSSYSGNREILHTVLLVASYFFYMSWDYRFGSLILISTLVDYYLAIKIDESEEESRRIFFLRLSLFLNLGAILGFFKYYNFVSGNVNSLFSIWTEVKPLPELYIILPVGISFFTFQSMSYTIDVYRKEISVERSFLKFALFVSFFPQLVAGPIVTAKTFLPQLYRDAEFSEIPFRSAIRYFFMGYVKKVVISDNISPIVDLIFGSPLDYGWSASWLGAVLFIIQIYCDFSGYSDMAYSSGLLLGYELPENFRLPLIGRNFTDFWRRWHISLSTWLKDYLYFSLGGSRVSYFRHKFNLFLTMLLAGLWHGANWNFLIWGGLQGIVLAIESAVHQKNKGKSQEIPIWRYIIQNFLTLSLFVFLGTLFRAQDLDKAFTILHNMLVFTEKGLRPYMVKIGSSVIVFLLVSNIVGYYIFEKKKTIEIPAGLEFLFYSVAVLLISFLTNDHTVPFIYFQF